MTGTIVRLREAYGFIHSDDPQEHRSVFFHRKDLESPLEYGPHLQEMRVEFVPIETAKGAAATCIRAAK